MTEQEMIKEVVRLKKEKKGVIFAHNYQIPEIQDIADFVGDSLELIQQAVNTDAELILFSGVDYLAESAKILAPNKKVLLPVLDAGCPMVNMVDAEQLRVFRREYPHIPILCYINSSAAAKAESDLCCTASNVVELVREIEADKILFVPDQNIGRYLAKQVPEKEIINWEGFCMTHHMVKPLEVDVNRRKHPEALVLVHPECSAAVAEKADFVGSTTEIIRYANQSEKKEFIIGTEMGVLHRLRKENPNKKFYLLSPSLTCFNMKKTALGDIYHALLKEQHEIKIDEAIRQKAQLCLEKMFIKR
ncbi:quinolinate synthase NadA [Geosporobacter ferrireducens]|uniref:Quinolinate synthase n=1 Tax=Geosporobacter ferrireducens TaxID=1424294 RepID=A0A1D8GHQ4_9FIRM|nr:quinolinate synthase NadA [Geosporobacter ferrireducens]AOT70410.1 quinolinate synthase [Geosporobacter ferrireducens]MTI58149.1 quinolinate synthase NadA [Geosporobacter ferrireducens]